VPNLVAIGQTFAEISRFNGFQNGGRPPSWSRVWRLYHPQRVFGAFITVQNLVEINAVVSIIHKF